MASEATLSTILPMSGGSGAFTTGYGAASRPLACCSGVAFGDVPVFDMMSLMLMVLPDMQQNTPAALDDVRPASAKSDVAEKGFIDRSGTVQA